MTKRSVLGGFALICALGGCADYSPKVAYTTPGWYLERPRLFVPSGPEIFAGPFTYEQCEAERVKVPDESARRLLCIQEKSKPGPFGPYSASVSTPKS